MNGPSPLWQGHRVVVCLGSGGVGKTTVAAALAIAAAQAQKRTLVMTIDPARRLAQALDLADLGNQPQQVPASRLGAGAARLDVLMPDVRGTFDGLVRRWAPSEAAARFLLNNPIYQHFASALAGSHEYAAVETLYEAYTNDAYDFIVVDTPPAQNAMVFLQAPDRVLNFLGTDAVRWLLSPGQFASSLGNKLLGFGGGMLLRGVAKVAGTATLDALVEFVRGFDSMAEGFVQRAAQVKALFADPCLRFVLVTAPQPAQVPLARRFVGDLEQMNLQIGAAICNRLRPAFAWSPQTSPPELDAALDMLPAGDKARLREALAEEAELAEQDGQAAAALQQALGPNLPLLRLPELPPPGDLMELVRLIEADGASAGRAGAPQVPADAAAPPGVEG
jgi:anion-transporting  ArsA/GET3 family ATPase